MCAVVVFGKIVPPLDEPVLYAWLPNVLLLIEAFRPCRESPCTCIAVEVDVAARSTL